MDSIGHLAGEFSGCRGKRNGVCRRQGFAGRRRVPALRLSDGKMHQVAALPLSTAGFLAHAGDSGCEQLERSIVRTTVRRTEVPPDDPTLDGEE
ncbi:hypothetical protein [Micromonospora chokoriensis]|uniref:hypothetical protein n=1 Tax=Micromonospora chokoriensis TaxID=356851 RepID=UPI001E558DF1|nr:hypothetical protein [Micromonospora chokoriensis]